MWVITVLSAGQVVLGGGAILAVVGRNTGAQAVSTAPSARPQVTETDPAKDVFQVDDDSSLVGLSIGGDQIGVAGDSVTGFILRDLEVSDAAKSGLYLSGINSGTISGNTATLNDEGFYVKWFHSGTMIGNMATSNSSHGFLVGGQYGNGFKPNYFTASNTATFESNISSDNIGQGYDIEGMPKTGSGPNFGHRNASNDSF